MVEKIRDLYPIHPGWSSTSEHKFRECHHPEHYPPNMMYYQPGVYRHTCPCCGKVTEFTVYHEGEWL